MIFFNIIFVLFFLKTNAIPVAGYHVLIGNPQN